MNSEDPPICSSRLTLELLEKHPVWGSFDEDDSEVIRPVISQAPFAVDCDPLIIRADFMTQGGRSLSGCVWVNRAYDKVYLAEIFINDKIFGFNAILSDLAAAQLDLLRHSLSLSNEPVFPLRFYTPVKGPDGGIFSGSFSIDFAKDRE